MDIVKILQNGGIGVVPTDTIYGLVGSAFSEQAVRRIYKVRGRNPNKPCIILISSISDLKKFGVSDSAIKTHREIFEKVWPGKVSLILPIEKSFYRKLKYLHRGTKTLAFRLPKKKSLINLLQKTDSLIAPSANPEGKSSARSVSEAKKYFRQKVDFYVSEGTKSSKPSTLISLTKENPKILRQGGEKINP